MEPKTNLFASILYHGAALGQAGMQAAASGAAAPPKAKSRKGGKGCTPCQAKKTAAAMIKRSGV